MKENDPAIACQGAMQEFWSMLDKYGDATLGIAGTMFGGAGFADIPPHQPTGIPYLRITRRNNVVVEVDGDIYATALSTWGIRGRKARAAAAENMSSKSPRVP